MTAAPLPSRISFYTPVANSIDLSTDYWKRGNSRPVVVGIRVDHEQKEWLGKGPWEYVLSPHTVRFDWTREDLRFSIAYDFGKSSVSTVMTIRILNSGSIPHELELYTHMRLTLRSCQSYAWYDSAHTEYDARYHAVTARFDDAQLATPAVIVQNAGIPPSSWTTSAEELGVSDSGWSNWLERDGPLKGTVSRPGTTVRPVAAFTYRISLAPGDSAEVIQLLSSVPQKELPGTAAHIGRVWKDDVAQYGAAVRRAAYGDAGFHSGHAWTDSSVSYARALLASNQHSLDGVVVPMPCPAEYNFFFTHDLLLTDLSAIAFDPGRVRRDLLYVAGLARDSIIPHAYYWKDDGFKTEYCSPGNWNNIWFILGAATYLRHTMDTATVLRIYPLLTKSLTQTLSRRSGNVMHGVEPDWWDFGHASGARAYLTILTVRALEEYVFISAWVGRNLSQLSGYETIAAELRNGLREQLWDDQAGYLLNTIGGDRDRHIYMGPLLAAVYGQLPAEHAQQLVSTAQQHLLDPLLGLRTVAPADFHTDSVKALYVVKGNEAGDAFTYANGGVWYLGNAWYAWAVRSIGDIEGAFDFFTKTMTLDGIVRSPSGQPALYEYRFADADASDHGRVDKPTMMWAAGFCAGSAYRMAGMQDNIWNVTVAGDAPRALENVQCAYTFGGAKVMNRRGSGTMLTRFLADAREIPSRILPLDAASASTLNIEMGPIRYPFLDSVNAILRTAALDPPKRRMTLGLSSFPGHATTVTVITPWYPRSVALNGTVWNTWGVTGTPRGTLVLRIQYNASAQDDRLEILF